MIEMWAIGHDSEGEPSYPVPLTTPTEHREEAALQYERLVRLELINPDRHYLIRQEISPWERARG